MCSRKLSSLPQKAVRKLSKKSFNFIGRAAPAKEVGAAGKKTPIFPAGKVAIWIAKQDKFMAVLRWFLPRGKRLKQNYISIAKALNFSGCPRKHGFRTNK